ncbi:hypothetical protein SteCoe_15851 [Stentor coeruleus]|uniref:Peptidase M14 domain-containing protein n=1 Tax=Stentor coeruleus TaxID=5963 RepID=A0A1R2C2K0_9CILI|nr:hypothetical protein SteCoe_15851 [Stentor coeruleus]
MFIALLAHLTIVSAYGPLDYNSIKERFSELESRCEFIKVTSAQKKYGIAYPDHCDGCEHMIVTIGSSLNPSTPQVYFSGCLHGDERVGPVVLTELATYICDNYDEDEWIKRIVDTRTIIMTPMTNAVGYYRNQREEMHNKNSDDPNRDFPFDNPYSCFSTLAAKTIQKIYEEYLIIAGITFHGGESSLTYPWGAYNHYKNGKSTEAPDDAAFKSISKALLKYSEANLKVGTMSDVVYPVNGGLEDWAYAGGWDNQKSPCFSQNFSNPEGLRQAFFLVEAHDNKSPKSSLYGNVEEVKTGGGGLIPQYIRMTLSLTDIAKPYITHKVTRIPAGVLIEWELWGCIDVVYTQIYYTVTVSSNEWETWNSTQKFTGGCKWGNFTQFSQIFKTDEFYFVIIAKVDDWTQQITPDPNISPQTHMVRMRNSQNYKVKNSMFEIVGDDKIVTQIHKVTDVPMRQLRALLPQGEFIIKIFPGYIDIISQESDLNVSNYGDYRYTDQTESLMKILCNIKGPVKIGKYKNCNDPYVLAGKLIMTSDGKSSAIIEAEPSAEMLTSAICQNKDIVITINKENDKTFYVSVYSDYNWVQIKNGDNSINVTLEQGKGNKFWKFGNNLIIGATIKYKSEKNMGSCVVGIAENTKFSHSYTKIELPKWALAVLIFAKVLAVLIIIAAKLRRKKGVILTERKYEELDLV